MKPEVKLDHILKFLYEEYLKDNILYVHSKEICHFAELDVSPSEAYLIMEKLNIDGYVDVSHSNQWMFKINYNGVLFHRKGGYEDELRDINRKRTKEDIYNIITAVGAIIAILYAVWQFFIEFSKHYVISIF
ncbi:hypothetical protein [Flavobacterium sp. KBS0721]|uniref:hypothetical protein n=1 Tax=Flavobacterium sp. KBS0721 TaxID=1179672 RepID=UPI00098FF73F|nr:hypothetical protein [Flavobacterium sp. KBS0721]QDW21819.1 hypothetical protein B0M43_0017435 [Flavobacterium sp. KBS0721]